MSLIKISCRVVFAFTRDMSSLDNPEKSFVYSTLVCEGQAIHTDHVVLLVLLFPVLQSDCGRREREGRDRDREGGDGRWRASRRRRRRWWTRQRRHLFLQQAAVMSTQTLLAVPCSVQVTMHSFRNKHIVKGDNQQRRLITDLIASVTVTSLVSRRGFRSCTLTSVKERQVVLH